MVASRFHHSVDVQVPVFDFICFICHSPPPPPPVHRRYRRITWTVAAIAAGHLPLLISS